MLVSPKTAFRSVAQALSTASATTTTSAVVTSGQYDRQTLTVKNRNAVLTGNGNAVLAHFTLHVAGNASVEMHNVAFEGTLTISALAGGKVVLHNCCLAAACKAQVEVGEGGCLTLSSCTCSEGSPLPDHLPYPVSAVCIQPGGQCRLRNSDLAAWTHARIRLVGAGSALHISHTSLNSSVTVALGASCDISFSYIRTLEPGPVIALSGRASLKHCHLDAGDQPPVLVDNDAASVEYGNVTTCERTAQLTSGRPPHTEVALPLFSGNVSFTLSGCGIGVQPDASAELPTVGFYMFKATGKPVCHYFSVAK